MALYRLKDSPYWWFTLVNPKTNQRIRKSTKLTDKGKAKAFEQQVMASLVLGEHHYALDSKKRLHTWNDAATRWLEETKDKKDHPRDIARIQWLHQHLANKPLAEITTAIIHRLGETRAQESSKPTANRTLAVIRAILNRCHKEWGWMDKAVTIKLYKENKQRIRYLSKAEAQRLLHELPPHLQNMALFSLTTGLRASNVVGLRWNQVDLKHNHLWIHPDQAKAGKAIAVPLNATALRVLTNLQGIHPVYVFTFKGQPVTRPNNHAWRKALRRAGIGDFRWHDLRHTWATWHIQAGTPLHVLQELGGWSNYEMVRRYAHLTSDHLRNYSQLVNLEGGILESTQAPPIPTYRK